MGGRSSEEAVRGAGHVPGLQLGCGARDVEERLVAAVLGLLDEGGSGLEDRLARLACPIRVIVPSAGLRQHVAARLLRDRPSLLGVEVQTLFGVARQLVARGGGGEDADRLLPVLIGREARGEPALVRDLGALEDSDGPVVGAVRDLLDAAFEAPLAEALLEGLAEQGAGGRAVERAQALVRVAARVLSTCEAHRWLPPSGLFLRAAEVLDRAGEAAMPSAAVLIHGFADATGAASELLSALVNVLGASLWLADPDDPAFAAPSGDGATRPPRAPGWGFTSRLRGRLGSPDPPRPPPRGGPVLRLQRAAGATGELRAAADRIRALLDGGTPPERIAIVARELGPYRLAASSQLRRLGIPFSGGRGFATRETRRLHALLGLLKHGPQESADRWLDAADRYRGAELADLRLGLHGLGVGRLADVARLEVEARLGDEPGLRLPVVRGLDPETAEPPPAEPEAVGPDSPPDPRRAGRLDRRRVPRETLLWAEDAARQAVARLDEWPASAPLREHVARLHELAQGALAWGPDTPGRSLFEDAAGELAGSIDPELVLSGEELSVLLARALEGAGEASLGGRGGGVQLLSAMEARGRTFDHLFLLGLNRDVFPRRAGDDPILPDDLRRCLEPLLLEIPIKGRSTDEERYLFAWLVSSAAAVTLSWQAVSEDGKERPRSPLLDRVALVQPALPVEEAPNALLAVSPLRPGVEHLIRAGLAGAQGAYRQLLGALLPEPRASARWAVLEELEARGERWKQPGPYAGFVGADAGRSGGLFVTRLEGLSLCPWRHFLERLLGLEPIPDAFAALPDVGAALLGTVVHDALESIVRRGGAVVGGTIEEARAKGPRDLPWPGDEELGAILDESAAQIALREGIPLPAFARFLARRARPLVDRIGELEAGEGVLRSVLGAELGGEVEVPGPDGRPRTLRFRADRVDDREKGLLLVDYKTGAPVSLAVRPSTREQHLLAQIREGRRLQVAAYASLPGAREGQETVGRFVFARTGLEDTHALVEVAGGDAATRQGFRDASVVLLEALERGALPPRLLNGKRTGAASLCESCELGEACARGDSAARRRHGDWLATSGGGAAAAAARAVIALHGGA
ncbi:MAG: PD-(D/E)XK nuclease family protein [Planctomycetota bacterium]|nr:PD-(D/E)XK nuclease family protein [Planctomycetota bacterium]